MLLLFVSACTTPEPEPEPPPKTETEAPAPVTWRPVRDLEARFSAEVPTDLETIEKTWKLGELETPWKEVTGRSFGALRSEVRIGWTERTPAIEALGEPLPLLAALAHAPDDATAGPIAGFTGLRWEQDDALAHHTRAVFVTPERLYWVRFLDNEASRNRYAHDRFFDSLQILTEASLSDADKATLASRQADQERLEAEAAEIEAARLQKEADIAAGRRAPDADVIRTEALLQSQFLSCLVPSSESGAVNVKISVRRGRVTDVKVYSQPQGWSNNMPRPKRRTDMLAMCIGENAATWRFDEDLDASNVEFPMVFY